MPRTLASFCLMLVVAAVVAASASAYAGTISGTVTDRDSGLALFAADVVVEGTGLGGMVGRDGDFCIEGVPEGTYSVSASMMGYASRTLERVVVLPDGTATVDFKLDRSVLDIGLNVTVAAKPFARQSDKPTSHRTLTRKEIERAPGGMEDVFRALQSMPGVSPVDMTTSDIVVRGGNPTENRTLLENIEIPSPLHFGQPGGRMGGVSIVHPGLIDEIDFMSGGFPARYGDKMSSVFEMKLRDGDSQHVNTNVDLNVAGFSVVVDGPISGGGTMVCSVRRGVFDLLTTTLGIDALPAYWDVVGKVTYNVGASDKLSIVGVYYPDDLEMGADPDGSERHGTWSELDLWRRDRGGAFGVNWRHMFGDRGYLLTTASRTTNAWNSRQGSSEGPALLGEDVSEQEIHLKSDLSYQLSDRLSLRAGVFGEQIRSDYRAWGIADTTITGDVAPAYEMNYDPPIAYKAGSYAQATLRPFGRLSLSAGLRYDYYDLTGESSLSPRLGLALGLTKRTSLTASYGHFYQTAAPYQVAQNPLNRALHSSRSVHTVVGVAHELSDDTRLTVELYQKELDNGFVQKYSTKEITNEGSGVARGVELCIQKKMGRRLVGSVAYSYSVTRLRDRSDLAVYYSEFDRPHNLTLVGTYKFSDAWQVGAKFHYASGTPYTPVEDAVQRDGGWYMVRGPRNSERYPNYHVLDVRVDRTFHIGGCTLSAYLDVWNVYGQKNITLYGFEVDDSGTVRRLTENDGVPRALPILGIEARF